MKIKPFILLLILSSMSGCVAAPRPPGAYVFSRSEPQVPISELRSVRVTWADNTFVPFNIHKSVQIQKEYVSRNSTFHYSHPKGTPQEQQMWSQLDQGDFAVREMQAQSRYKLESAKASALSPEEMAQGNQYLRQMLSYFEAQAVPKIRKQLEVNNVLDGGDMTLEISPDFVYCSVPCVGVGAGDIRLIATVRRGEDKMEMWSVTMDTFGPFTNEVLLDNFVRKLMVELKTAGWLANNEKLTRLPLYDELVKK
jgi:hypothetical protein